MRMGIQTARPLALFTLTFAMFLTGGVLSSSAATAATYYVATTGSDANPGSQARPFQTLNKGVSMLQAGDTLSIRGGTYTSGHFGQRGTGTMPSGTSWTNAITIAAYPGETVTLAGDYAGISLVSGEQYIIFDRVNIDVRGYAGRSGIFLCCGVHHIRYQNGEIQDNHSGVGDDGNLIFGNASFIEFLNNKIHGSTWYAFYWQGHDCVFDGNEIYDNFSYGMHIYHSGYNDVSNNIVRNNIIHDNGLNDPRGYPGCGLLLASGGNNIAYNNIIYNNGCGIQVDYTNGATNNQVYNNTVYNNRDFGISIGSRASNTIVKSNIVYGNGSAITNWGDSGAVISNNLTSNPMFVNTSANDFRLQSTSPAIDAGVTLSAVSTDLNKLLVPKEFGYDIGAYEYQVSIVPAPRNFKAISVTP